MRCSDCSKPIRPVVAVDIDGTLGEYHNHFRLFAEHWLGRSIAQGSPYRGAEPYRDWFCRMAGVDPTTFRMIKLAYRQGGLKRSMQAFPGAARMMRGLMGDGEAEVWLTTTRPHDRYDRVDPDTREWMRRNGIESHGLLFDRDKYARLSQIVEPERVVFVLDDLLTDLGCAQRAFPLAECWLRGTRFNNEVEYPHRVLDLDEGLALARSKIRYWYETEGERS